MEPVCEIDENGTERWYLNHRLHRDDGPAVITCDGFRYWYQNNKLHREDGPAVIYPNNIEIWYQCDKIHRIDGPALIRYDGTVEFWAFNINYDSLEELQIRIVMDR